MEKRKPTLRQRRWATGEKGKLTLIMPPADLESRVKSASGNEGVRVREHFWVDPNRFAFTELGFVNLGRKKGYAAARGHDNKWYILDASPGFDTGKFYQGSTSLQDVGILGRISGKQQFAFRENGKSLFVIYDTKSAITLEDALRFKKHYAPVYEGSTYEFAASFGPFRKAAPFQALTAGGEEAAIAGIIHVSPDDYLKMSSHYRKNGYNLIMPYFVDATNVTRHRRTGKVASTLKKLPRVPHYKAPKSMSPEVRKQLWLQSGGDPTLTSVEGLDSVLEAVVKYGEFKANYVNRVVTSLERVRVNPTFWKGSAWIATTDNPQELYIVLDPANMGIYEITQQGSKAVSIVPPRPIKDELYWWPHSALKPEEVLPSLLWKLGIGNRIEIDGYVAAPYNEFKLKGNRFKNSKVMGVLGMNKSTWRSMFVKEAAYEVVSGLERDGKGINISQLGAEDGFVLEKAKGFYAKNPLLETVSGGEAAFANSVLLAVRKYYGVPQVHVLK